MLFSCAVSSSDKRSSSFSLAARDGGMAQRPTVCREVDQHVPAVNSCPVALDQAGFFQLVQVTGQRGTLHAERGGKDPLDCRSTDGNRGRFIDGQYKTGAALDQGVRLAIDLRWESPSP